MTIIFLYNLLLNTIKDTFQDPSPVELIQGLIDSLQSSGEGTDNDTYAMIHRLLDQGKLREALELWELTPKQPKHRLTEKYIKNITAALSELLERNGT